MSIPVLLLFPILAALLAYTARRSRGRLAAGLVWVVAFGIAFVPIQRYYADASGCDYPATVFVPLIGALIASSGALVGITRGADRTREYGVLRLALESALTAAVLSPLFIMMLWPCR